MRKMLLAIGLFFTIMPAFAGDPGDSTDASVQEMIAYAKFMDSVNNALKYETGAISLPSKVVRLNVPKGFKYLGVEQSKYVIETLWGNPPNENLEGMLFPENADPFSDSSYAFIISYSAVGHIKDGDARDIDYDELLKDMKADEKEDNDKRKAMGSYGMYIQGWAAKPYYDETKKVLHWAVDYTVDGAEEHTLNYNIIVLGRKGMLSMNAIGNLSQLSMVQKDVGQVLNIAEYTEGNRYADFDSNVDEVAAWTVGGLVAGKLLLGKTAAGAGILKFLKFIILGIVAIGAFLWKRIRGKKKEEQLAYEPSITPQEPQQPGNS